LLPYLLIVGSCKSFDLGVLNEFTSRSQEKKWDFSKKIAVFWAEKRLVASGLPVINYRQ